jgi:glutamine synthetase
LRRYAHLDRTAVVLADCLWPDHSPVEYSPRRILRRQLERCEARGLMPVCAAETEFFVFAESYESAQEKNWCQLDRLHQFPPDYSVLRSDLDEPILGAIRRQAIASGIPIETTKQELGKGQVELALTYCEALEAADRITLFKNIAKAVADQMGMSASFMARVDHRESGSSGHVHQSVWDLECERNLMAEVDDPKRLSELGRWWIGGQMAVAQELMPLFCPNVNSYKRLTVENFAPTTIAWGLDVRTAAFRLVGSGGSMNFENRIPGADANFYLVIAGMIAGGLHGIENRIEPPDPPLRSAERTQGDRLPLTLPAALERFRSSEFARAALGDKVVDHLCVAADHELAVHAREVSDIEKRRLFQWA